MSYFSKTHEVRVLSDGVHGDHRPYSDWLSPLWDFYTDVRANRDEWLPSGLRQSTLQLWVSIHEKFILDRSPTAYGLLFAALVVWSLCRFNIVNAHVRLLQLEPPAWQLNASVTSPNNGNTIQSQIVEAFDKFTTEFPRHAELWKAMNFGDRNGVGSWNIDEIKQQASPDQDKQMPGYLLKVENGKASVRAGNEQRWDPQNGTKWDAVLRLKEGIDDLVDKYIDSIRTDPIFGNMGMWKGEHDLNFNSLYTWMYYLREDFIHYVEHETIPGVQAVPAQPAGQEEIRQRGRVRMRQVPEVPAIPERPEELARPGFPRTFIKTPRAPERLSRSPARCRQQAPAQARMGARLPRTKSVHPSVVDEVFAMWRVSKMDIA